MTWIFCSLFFQSTFDGIARSNAPHEAFPKLLLSLDSVFKVNEMLPTLLKPCSKTRRRDDDDDANVKVVEESEEVAALIVVVELTRRDEF